MADISDVSVTVKDLRLTVPASQGIITEVSGGSNEKGRHMVSIALEEISETLAQAIRQLGENEEIVLTENQRPIARLTPISLARVRARRGSMKDMIVAIAPDFDATPDGFEEYMP